MRTHGVAWALVCALMIVAIGVSIAGVALLKQIQDWTADLPSLEATDAFSLAEKSTVYAADGQTVLAEFQIENRTPLESLDDISVWLVLATIDIEDARFYEHNGVDYWGLLRAFVNNITGGEVQGASTITQQLVKNTVLSQEATEMTIRRKIREAALALELEDLYSKDEILLMYLNTINYGDGCYGIEAAARHYFNKPAKELTMLEAATLAGIPQSPANLNPVDNPEACTTRRNYVLQRMRVAGDITAEEYGSAINQPLGLDVQVDDSFNGIYLYPYFTTYVRDQLLSKYSTADIFAGGLTIYTTLDVSAQEAAEQACADNYRGLTNGLEYAMVAVEPSTGHIKAMVGGKDFFEDQFNIATTKGRPTGSTFKMFTLVTAIEQGINPSTLIDCRTPLTVTTAQGKHEINNMNGIDYGIIPISTATAWSANTGYVRLMLKVTAHSVIQTAKRLGITAALPEVPTLTLGVADITPLEMASAYGCLATYGVRHEPICITRIVDRSGSTIYLAEEEGVRVMTESVAGATTTVLKGVVAPGGTATAIRMFDGRDVAAKTGSSDDWKDRWTIAYTPSISVACWLGDRDNKISWWGNNTTNYVVNQFMNAYLRGTPYEKFPSYTNPPYNNPYNREQNIELGKQELKEAPNVVGKKIKDALKTLDGYPVLYVEEYNADKDKGIVYDQKVDNTIKEIILYVSKGKNPNPDDATITLQLDGGYLAGYTDTITRTAHVDDTITLPRPARDGYRFLYWTDSSHPAGSTLKVAGDTTLIARWEKLPDPEPEPEPDPEPVVPGGGDNPGGDNPGGSGGDTPGGTGGDTPGGETGGETGGEGGGSGEAGGRSTGGEGEGGSGGEAGGTEAGA